MRAFLGAYLHRMQGFDGDFNFKMIAAVSDSDSLASRFADVAGKSVFDMSNDQIDSLREPVQRKLAGKVAAGNGADRKLIKNT